MEGSRRMEDICPVCFHLMWTHPRCSLCTILIGLGHNEQRGVLVGASVLCPDHGVSTKEMLGRAYAIDIARRSEYEEFPEMELDTNPLPRYDTTALPEWLITPKQAAGMTGWNSHTVRVRIAKNKIEQIAWAVSSLGWKSGLYDRERVLFILKRMEDPIIDALIIDIDIDNSKS